MSELPPDPGRGLVALAREAVHCHLVGIPVEIPEDVAEAFSEPAGAFVTIRRVSGELRGCVGTARPYSDSVAEEVSRVAPLAATGDRRFRPMTLDELSQVRFEVSVLSPLELVDGPENLDPHHFGAMIRELDGERGALLLPNIPGIETVERQMREIRLKAGIGPDTPIIIWRFEVDKYEEP